MVNDLYLDTYRFLHPSKREYTWTAKRLDITISTRIDHIWVSNNWVRSIMFCSIENMDTITHSDHNMATCMLDTGDIIRNFHVSARRRHDKPRTVYKYDSATQSDWDNYRALSD